jgi:hypothetical protein
MFTIYEKIKSIHTHVKDCQVKLTAQKGRASLSLSKSPKAKKPLAAMDFGGGNSGESHPPNLLHL